VRRGKLIQRSYPLLLSGSSRVLFGLGGEGGGSMKKHREVRLGEDSKSHGKNLRDAFIRTINPDWGGSRGYLIW